MSQGNTVPLERHTYEDPFLDMASTKLPKSFKKLLELCQIFAMTHPQISPIIQRLSEYPITSLVYKGDDESTEKQYKEIFEKNLKMLEHMIEFGLDYHAYGNCFVSISFPFIRMYSCKVCKTEVQASELKYKFRNGAFEGKCEKCKHERMFKARDQYIKNAEGINIFRLEPQLMTPVYNRVTGAYTFYYDIPPDIARHIKTGNAAIIDTTPIEYINCVVKKKRMLLSRVFHFKRPTLSGRDMQWGFPLVLPALKDAYLNQIYKKSDEAVALEHSVPLRVLYPESRTQDPMQKLALGNFKSFMARNIRYWRRDKNAIITSPMPIGVTNIGGDAAAYSTIQARIKVVDEIMGAMMVTRGFVMGGEQWSSASISQRVMENSFMNYSRRMDGVLQWICDEVSSFLSIPKCAVSMKPFKKVDDVQMLNLIIQLAREKKVSWEETLSRMDLDAKQEFDIIEKETSQYTQLMVQELLATNEANAKAMVSQAVAQQEAEGFQQVSGEMKQSGDQILSEIQSGQHDQQEVMVDMDMKKQIGLWAKELLESNDGNKRRLLQSLHNDDPELAKMVVDEANKQEKGGKSPTGAAVSRSKNTTAMVKNLVSEASSPEELAQKLTMIEPRQQNEVLLSLQKTNPTLANKVIKILHANNNPQQQQQKSGDGVNMNPLPEQKPPTRQDSTV